MNERKIYPNVAAARAAVAEYQEKVGALLDELGLVEILEDAYAPVWINARYFADDGKTIKILWREQ